jgi:hypothetical protein
MWINIINSLTCSFGHLLTRSGLTLLEVSLWSPLAPSASWSAGLQFPVIHYKAFRLCCKQCLLYSCVLPKTGVVFRSFSVPVFVLWSLQVYPAAFLLYFISAAVILLASLAVMVQFALTYNRVGRDSMLHSFIVVFSKVFYGLNILFIMSAIFKILFNLLSMSAVISCDINFLIS